MKDLVSSWNSVSKETIISCFKKPGISNLSKQFAVTGTADPFKSLTEDLSHFLEKDQNAVQEELLADSFFDLDNNVVTTVPISSDEDIVAEVLNPEEDNEIDEDIDGVDAEVKASNLPSNIELEEALDKLYNISLFSPRCGSKIQPLCIKMERTFHARRNWISWGNVTLQTFFGSCNHY